MSFSVQDDSTARCADNIIDTDVIDADDAAVDQLIDKIMQLEAANAHLQADNNKLQADNAQMEADNAQMKADFASFNRRLNKTARYFSWCNDYEARLDEYARDMKILRPVHRTKEQLGRNPDDYHAVVASPKACLNCGGVCYTSCTSCGRRHYITCPDCNKQL